MKKEGGRMRERWRIIGLVMGALMVTAGSCEHVRKDARYAERLCKNHPMVGLIQGAKLELEAKREKTESAKVSLGVERYEKLAQELKNYSAEWESLNQSTQLACTDWALCQYRFGETQQGACNRERDRMEERQESARKFLERMKKLDVGVENPGITNVVPMTRGPKLSGKEFQVDITVRNPTKNVLQLDQVRLDFYGPRGGMLAAVTEVSGTYTIVIDSDTGKAIVRAPGDEERYEAYAWFPSGCTDRFIVRSPIWQTIQPNGTDRFIVKVVFPENECMQKASFEHVKVELTYNGNQEMAFDKVSLTGGA